MKMVARKNDCTTMTMTSTPSELHLRLRQATKLAHHALDRHPILTPLLRADLSVAQYGDALAALHGVYAQAEDWIRTFLEQHPGLFNYSVRRKLPALESDLASLGRTPVPAVEDFTAPQTIGALIGILYTLEGSTLGGQFIARSLSQIPESNLPTRFFSGYGELSRQRWEEFLQFADAKCPIGEYEDVVATAISLFGAIKTHLDLAAQRSGMLTQSW